MNRLVISLLFLLCALNINAQNPIVPPGVYIADPLAHVWNDGKMYVYGSSDESTSYYCSFRHDVLVSEDLLQWELIPNIFSSKGKDDKVSYNDAPLYAPDCQYKNGKYYLYYCQPDGSAAEGVAIGESPIAPFAEGKKMELKGMEQIDPAVFIDDNGQAYYIWGQFTAKMAKLKPNMTEIDTATIVDNVVTEKEHFFHEGGYVVKRNGIYYFDAHMGRRGRPTCIGYATSKSPMGPYKYGGVMVDNNFSVAAALNNHGSIAEFKEQWYVFYHRLTHGSVMMRKACIEPITLNDDGSINEVEMTTQGAAGPMNPLDKMDAARACLLYGNVRIEANAADNEVLTKINNGDAAAYKYFDFDIHTNMITIRVAPGKINFALNSTWGPSIASVDVPGNGDGETWINLSAKLSDVKGVHALWLRFSGEGKELLSLTTFYFANRK